MRTTLAMLLMAFLALAPLAAAQDETKPDDNSTRPDDAAWVDDCPPDMMCAYGGEPGDEPTRGPADGSCEYCRGEDGEPIAMGPDDCIECMGPVDGGNGQTCMDGADAGEACDDDVQYIGGPPAEPISAPAETASEDAKTVPAASTLALVAIGFAAAVFVAIRRA